MKEKYYKDKKDLTFSGTKVKKNHVIRAVHGSGWVGLWGKREPN